MKMQVKCSHYALYSIKSGFIEIQGNKSKLWFNIIISLFHCLINFVRLNYLFFKDYIRFNQLSNMAAPASTSPEDEEVISKLYQYVIIGGGTAGLAIAARLTEDSAISVLVLEAGESRLEVSLKRTAW